MSEEMKNNEVEVETVVEIEDTEEKENFATKAAGWVKKNGKKALKIGAIGTGLIIAFALGSKFGGSDDEEQYSSDEDEIAENDETE